MKIFSICDSCQAELGLLTFEPYFASYYDDMLARFECVQGHKNISAIQNQKFEVLLESGAAALDAGFTLEAAATFSAALERFIEFCVKVMLAHQGMCHSLFDEMFKQMARQSERQLGAFIVLHALVLGVPFVPNSHIAPFRNSVIHKGEIPTPESVEKFCSNVYSEIFKTAELLRQNCKHAIDTVIEEDLRVRKMKSADTVSSSTRLCHGLYSITESNNKVDFSEAFKAYKKKKEALSQAIPEMKLILTNSVDPPVWLIS
jgi:hypothetical protein